MTQSRNLTRRRALTGAGMSVVAAALGESTARAARSPRRAAAATGGASTWFNVQAYGATGNGRSDDTNALDAACDAARATGGVGVVYVPAGFYRISSTINVWNVSLKGDGVGTSVILAGRDWAGGVPNGSWALDQQPSSAGVGQPASDASSLGTPPGMGTWVQDIWLSGPGSVTWGRVPSNLSGIRVGQGAGYGRMRIDGFYAGAFLFSDHEKLLGPGTQGGNYYGVYFGGPSATRGSQVISDIQLDGAAWASIGVAAQSRIQDAAIRKVHLGTAPFGIYREAGGSGPLLDGVALGNVSFESCGNGNIFSGGSGSGADVINCVFDCTGGANALDPGPQQPVGTTDSAGTPIGRLQATIDLGNGQWSENEVIGADPGFPHAGITNYSAMIACGAFSGGQFFGADDAIDRAVQDGKVFTTGSSSGDALVMYRGTSCRLLGPVSGSLRTGDVVELVPASPLQCRRATGSSRAIGIAMHAAGAGQTVPLAYSGLATVNSGTNTIAANDPVRPDPTQSGCVVTAALTDPAVIGVAQQPSANGALPVLLRGL